MKLVLFSGTSEGRRLSEYLSLHKVYHEVCVATESGEAVMEANAYAQIRVGRLSKSELRDYLGETDPWLVIDATHPYAAIVTEYLRDVCETLHLQYIRVNRESSKARYGDVCLARYDSVEACAKALCHEEGNIFLTTGSKDLAKYQAYPELLERLYVRVLPTREALDICDRASIDEKHIIAMYGPHTKAMNEAVMKQYKIRHLVTKESGQTGGFPEKMEACKALGTKLHVIERPENAQGIGLQECVQLLKQQLNLEGNLCPRLQMQLVGIGPGNRRWMTEEAKFVMEEADYVFGAPRMLENYTGIGERIPEYMPDKIIDRLEQVLAGDCREQIKVVALFSGDTGIYSGASKLYKKLKTWGKCDSLSLIPGISSFSAFSACIGREYQNVRLESLHGKTDDKQHLERLSKLIGANQPLFLLLSGKKDFAVLENLIPQNYGGEIIIGCDLTYETQRIIYTDLEHLKESLAAVQEGLFIVLLDVGCDE